MKIFMRFHYAIQATPAALTPLMRGVWAVWFCLADAWGYRPFAFNPPGRRVAGNALQKFAKTETGCTGAGEAPGSLFRWQLMRLWGNIREGPD